MWALLGIIVIVGIVVFLKKKNSTNSATRVKPDDMDTSGLKKNEFKVSGVTFEDRQSILSKLYATSKRHPAILEHYDYEGEDAILVKVNGLAIGNCPKAQISKISNIESTAEKILVDINVFDDEDGNELFGAYCKLYSKKD